MKPKKQNKNKKHFVRLNSKPESVPPVMPWWDMVLLLFIKGIIQEFKHQIDTNSNKFNHMKRK